MDQQTIDIVKATVPVLEEKGDAITVSFYNHLFSEHPELYNVFNQTHQKQQKQQRALAQAVLAAAKHIDKLEAILGSVKGIAHKHRSIGVKPEHYPIVGENLLWAIKDVLGDAATDEIMQAWEIAYGEIAKVFIAIEDALREEVKNRHGWNGYLPFKVDRKVEESSVITSFYLKPVNGQELPEFEAGQYISIKLDIPGEKYTHIRQYSLSDAPGTGYFRISVKREDARDPFPEGVVTNYLHESVKVGDVLQISAPAGDFTLDHTPDKPLVLISGGVGQTPMMSMLKQAVNQTPERNITWVHAAVNGTTHAFAKDVVKLDQQHKNLQTFFCYEAPTESDQERCLYAKTGYIDGEWLAQVIIDKNADYYFCGPKPFMKAIYTILKHWEIEDENIHFEFFGPQDQLVEKETATTGA
ncbi:nitric oxide dioxygenase [Scopulibacillus darangshiensis]|uniref:Flavohemoprotein n=1 Tax=Scopulibacillus darangshiensis TaxID=442528 RepID=A0A4R2PBE3_9BACL|nr:NO-inducible flavohemoprotein [Scopulibacillus darangshiensis]TCP32307.1 nitric oxide dioxygenase [Scopulibacillus darangshiensis]